MRLFPQYLLFALRSLRSRPALAASSAAVLSLGIAAVTTIFGVTSGVLFRPLPYPEPERLVFVLGSEPPGPSTLPLSPAEFELVRDEARSLRGLAALAEDVAVVGKGSDARSRRGIRVTPGLAETLGARVRLGRLSAPDERADVDAVLLGEDFWLRDLGASPDVLGQPIVLDGRPGRVSGVLSSGSRLKPLLGFEPAWWRSLDEGDGRAKGRRRLLVVGRLADGASLASAEAELRLLAQRLATSAAKPGRTLRTSGVRDAIDPVAYAFVALLLAAILGIVCLNVGNLLLARALARGREIAVRLALGAGRRDVFGLLVAEGVVVGLLGGGLGLVLTFLAVGLVRDLAAGTNAEALVFDVDAWVWTASAVVSLLAGVLAGLAPALYWLRQEPESLLKEGAHGATASPRSQRLRGLLIASEVALSLALLSQAGLVLQSLRGLLSLDRGFAAARVLTARLALPQGDPTARADEVLRRVRGMPGVRSAAFTTAIPAAAPLEPYRLENDGPAEHSGEARLAAVSPGYFETLGIPMRMGRDFAGADASGGALVAIVNDTLAGRRGTGAEALGAEIVIAGARRTVVGVVGTVRNAPLQMMPRPEVYVPWRPSGDAHLLVHTTLDRPLGLAGDLAAVLHAADLGEPPGAVRSLEATLSADMGMIRLGATLLGLVAMGALVLTAAGTYGVVSSVVFQRTREIGVRLALGAGPAGILRLVLKQGLQPVLAGVVVGMPLALAFGRLLASRVHGLRPVEPVLLAASGLAFGAVVALACYLPARRATRVDPAVTLRCE